MTVDCTKLTTDLLTARLAAESATTSMKDGGTCCFDHPYIRLPKRKDVLAAITAAGFVPTEGNYKGTVALLAFPGDWAQGGPRTAGARAVAESLRANGWVASVYYAMD